MTASIGYASQMALSATSSFSSSSLWLEFVSESITAQRVFSDSPGIRGTRSYSQERVRTMPYKVSGTVNLLCDIHSMDTLLAYILGTGPTSSVYSLTDALPSFYLMIDRVAQVFTYGPCYVGKATFSASPQDAQLKCALEVEAETESVGSAGSFPSGMTVDTNRPFIYSDAAFNVLGSTSVSGFSWELTIDNNLLADRFVNELTRSQIPTTDRHVTVKMSTPWTSAQTSLYNIAAASFGAATAVFSNAEETISSTQSVLTFSTPYLMWPGKSPVVSKKGDEIKLEIDAKAAKTGSSLELSVTNAHG
jgi:Phage tail tube protein